MNVLDEEARSKEIARRRRVVVLVSLGLIGVAVRGVLQLSVSTVERMRDLCSTTFDNPNTGEPITLQLPCHPQRVSEVAGWRWPTMLVTVALVVIAGVLLWLLMPRLTRTDGRRGSATRLKGTPLPGPRVRYRLHPVQRWLMYILAAPFLVGGVLLGALPTGAPAVIVGVFIACGALFAFSAGAGVVTASANGLTVRTNFRRREWQWSKIDRVAGVDGFVGPARAECRLLAIHTRDGRVFKSQALSSSPGWNGGSRIDQLVEALERWRKDATDLPSSPLTR